MQYVHITQLVTSEQKRQPAKLMTAENFLVCRLPRRFSIKLENAWQSLAYSLLGAIVSPLAYTCEKHLLTDHLSAEQPHPIANIDKPSVVTISDSGRTIFWPKTLG